MNQRDLIQFTQAIIGLSIENVKQTYNDNSKFDRLGNGFELRAIELKDAKGKVLVANGAQPTVDELRALNYLDAFTSSTLPIDTTKQIVFKNVSGDNIILPARFAIQISRVCVEKTGTSAAQTNYLSCTTPTGGKGYWDLTSLLFNAQPYATSSIYAGQGFNLMHMVFNAVGTDVLMATQGPQPVLNASGADVTNQFMLVGSDRGNAVLVPNPPRNVS